MTCRNERMREKPVDRTGESLPAWNVNVTGEHFVPCVFVRTFLFLSAFPCMPVPLLAAPPTFTLSSSARLSLVSPQPTAFPCTLFAAPPSPLLLLLLLCSQHLLRPSAL